MEYFYFVILVSGIQTVLMEECRPCDCCKTERCISLENGDFYCMDGCRDGFFGKDCTSMCALRNCARCLSNDTCEQCLDGYMSSYRGDCEESCPLCKTCIWPTGFCDSCEPGYQPYNDRCEKNENCLVYYGHGSCDKCKKGLWGYKCTSKCSPGCEYGICDLDGHCKCVETYWGARCDISCNFGCEDGTCNDVGHCKCSTGFWGETCEHRCSEGCLDECAPDGSCKCKSHAFGQRCIYNCTTLCTNGKCNENQSCVCYKGYWGTFCTNECSVGCQKGICDLRGNCECSEHFWGLSCDKGCSYGCEDSLCSSTDGTCICKHNYYGYTCEQRCELGCVGDTCSKSGSCQCKSGYWGKQCSFICSLNCLTPSCDKDTGYCQCKLGFWGESCHFVCNENCSDNTCRVDRKCLCKTGNYGKYCNMACSNGCINNTCDMNGNCNCKVNYSGRRCENHSSGIKLISNICKNGYFFKADGTCTACPSNCINGVCDIETGYCECKPNYWGSRCNFLCSKECLNKLSCLKNGSCECKQNAIGDFCEKCKDGYSSNRPGAKCEACPITCETCGHFMYSDICTRCKPGFFGQTCSETCLYSCKTCKNKDMCTSCYDGFYGITCQQPCPHNCPKCSISKGTCDTTDTCVNNYCTKCNNECQYDEYRLSSKPSPQECTDGNTASSDNLENGDLPYSTFVGLLVTFGIVNSILLGVIVFIVVIERRTGESVVQIMTTQWTRRLGRQNQHQATMTEMNARTGNEQTHVYEDLERTEVEGNYPSTATEERYAGNSGNTVNEGSHHIYQNSVPLEERS